MNCIIVKQCIPHHRYKFFNQLNYNTMTMNSLQLHMLLLDSVMHYKTGMHTTRNYTNVKRMFCSAMGMSSRTSSKKMIEAIGYVYMSNGMGDKFRETCERFELQVN